MKVLFVDDNHLFLSALKMKFEDVVEGTFCYTGAEGLEHLRHNQFDVVVLDLMMFLDGVTFVKLANGRLKNSKVYFLSGLPMIEIEARIEPIKNRVQGCFEKSDIQGLEKVFLSGTLYAQTT